MDDHRISLGAALRVIAAEMEARSLPVALELLPSIEAAARAADVQQARATRDLIQELEALHSPAM
ncbi:MAG: hypothetical protein ACFBWO_08450 [Paracoccaceae bacterium]